MISDKLFCSNRRNSTSSLKYRTPSTDLSSWFLLSYFGLLSQISLILENGLRLYCEIKMNEDNIQQANCRAGFSFSKRGSSKCLSVSQLLGTYNAKKFLSWVFGSLRGVQKSVSQNIFYQTVPLES